MHHETLPPIEQLDRMDDISGSALYSAEVKRIPFLTAEEQAAYTTAALQGDTNACNELLANCLNWVLSKAASTYMEREPTHTDLMDLVGHASVKMLEALPKALTVDDPVRYLMSVGALEMKLYCIYDDPLVKRSRSKAPDSSHPMTVSIEAGLVAPLHRLPGPEVRLSTEDAQPGLEYQIVAEALAGLPEKRRRVLTAAYGLSGHPAMRIADIALMLNVSRRTVENNLYRAKRDLAEKLGPYLTELGLHAA